MKPCAFVTFLIIAAASACTPNADACLRPHQLDITVGGLTDRSLAVRLTSPQDVARPLLFSRPLAGTKLGSDFVLAFADPPTLIGVDDTGQRWSTEVPTASISAIVTNDPEVLVVGARAIFGVGPDGARELAAFPAGFEFHNFRGLDVVGSIGEQLVVLAAPTFASTTVATPGPVASAAFIDLDGDGDDDAVVGVSTPDAFVVLESVDGALAERARHPLELPTPPLRIRQQADGAQVVFLVEGDGGPRIATRTLDLDALGDEVELAAATGDGDVRRNIVLNDVDGDGNDDVVVEEISDPQDGIDSFVVVHRASGESETIGYLDDPGSCIAFPVDDELAVSCQLQASVNVCER